MTIKCNVKKCIEILAWVALPMIFVGFLEATRMCSISSCGSYLLKLMLPLGFLILLINAILKKDYQVSVVLVVLSLFLIRLFF